jgi:hypothetical protein
MTNALGCFSEDVQVLKEDDQSILEQLQRKAERVTVLRRQYASSRTKSNADAAAANANLEELASRYEDVVRDQDIDIDDAKQPTSIKLTIDGKKQSEINLDWHMADMKSMMLATPIVVRKIQAYTLEAAHVNMTPGWQQDQSCVRTMRRLRLDAGDTVAVIAGIVLSKALRILAMWVDETEKQLVSQLSVMIIYLDEHGQVRWLSLGSKVLESKTAAESVRCMLAEFARTKQLHIMCKEQYSAMIKKLEAGGEVKGIREEEWAAIRDAGGYSAEDVFGDSDKINPCRIESGGIDHCNGAKAGLRITEETIKTETRLVQYHGDDKWTAMNAQEKHKAKMLLPTGCYQHLRCFGTGAGHKVVEEYITALLKDDVETARQKGIRCVTGQQMMSLRTLFVGLGNTTKQDHRSLGDQVHFYLHAHASHFSVDQSMSMHACSKQ